MDQEKEETKNKNQNKPNHTYPQYMCHCISAHFGPPIGRVGPLSNIDRDRQLIRKWANTAIHLGTAGTDRRYRLNKFLTVQVITLTVGGR